MKMLHDALEKLALWGDDIAREEARAVLAKWDDDAITEADARGASPIGEYCHVCRVGAYAGQGGRWVPATDAGCEHGGPLCDECAGAGHCPDCDEDRCPDCGGPSAYLDIDADGCADRCRR